jgi:hypothetical protein
MLGTQYDKGKRQSYSTTFPIETTTSLPVLNKKQHSSSTKLSLGSLVLSDQGPNSSRTRGLVDRSEKQYLVCAIGLLWITMEKEHPHRNPLLRCSLRRPTCCAP